MPPDRLTRMPPIELFGRGIPVDDDRIEIADNDRLARNPQDREKAQSYLELLGNGLVARDEIDVVVRHRSGQALLQVAAGWKVTAGQPVASRARTEYRRH